LSRSIAIVVGVECIAELEAFYPACFDSDLITDAANAFSASDAKWLGL